MLAGRALRRRRKRERRHLALSSYRRNRLSTLPDDLVHEDPGPRQHEAHTELALTAPLRRVDGEGFG